MATYLEQVFRQLPPGLPSALQLQEYSSGQMTVLRLRTVFSEPRAFESYKFLIPLSAEHPREHVDRRVHTLPERGLFAVNPGQAHGAVVRGDMHDTRGYMVMFVDPVFLGGLAGEVFGREDLRFQNRVVFPSPGLWQDLRLLQEEAGTVSPGRDFMLQSLTVQIGVGLLRETPHNLMDRAVRPAPGDRFAVERVIDYLHAHYGDPLSLDEVARAVNYSPYHLARLFKAPTGRTLFRRLLEIKVERAKQLLRFGDKTVTEICFLCGFNNRSHFASTFKREVGVSPQEYRRLLWGGPPAGRAAGGAPPGPERLLPAPNRR